MEDERQRRGEPLFLALTRPPIMPLLGLPHGLALLFVVTGAETVIFTKGFIALLALVPLWAAATLYVRNDWNAMRVLGLFLRSKIKSVDVHRWGGASLSPFPLQSTAPRGIVHDPMV
jgi:type IV secretion system protein VirB3